MQRKLILVLSGIILVGVAAFELPADEVEMQNGDRYFGDVLSVSAGTVVLQNENLGKISVPRNKVTSLTFGTNVNHKSAAVTQARISPATNPAPNSASAKLNNTDLDLSAMLRALGSNTNFIGQIKDQLLGGNSAASQKYDQMINDLLNGKLDMNELRRQAQSSANQIRELERELGPDAGDSLDAYLRVLDQFLKETASEPATGSPSVNRRNP